MTTTTLQKRLSKMNVSKNSIAYKIALDVINKTNLSYCIKNDLIRPVYTSGRGRFTSNMDYTSDLIGILDFLKLKYIVGNDSPRGGLVGNFIKIVTKIS